MPWNSCPYFWCLCKLGGRFSLFLCLVSTLLWYKNTLLRMCESKLSEWAEKQVHAKREPCGAGNCVCLSSKHCEKLGGRKPVSIDSQALLPPFRERWQCGLTIHERQQPWQTEEGGAGTWCWRWRPAAGRNSGVRSFHPVLGFSDQCAKRMENTPQWNCLDSMHSGSSTVRLRPTSSSELGTQEGVSLCLLDVPVQLLPAGA